MANSRRQLGGFAVLALVLLRLAIGWHFFSEGVEKLEYDSATGHYRVAFSAEGFLSQAKGPLAEYFHSLAPDGHGWKQLLATARQNPPAAAPTSPYHAWEERIARDWTTILSNVTAIPGLTEVQRRQAADVFEQRRQELSAYLATQSDAIAEYQHELWRLAILQAAPEAKDLPFQQERIATKAAQTASQPRPWVNQVNGLEQSFLADLRQILTPEQRTGALMRAAMNGALISPQQARFNWVNVAATALTLGVGVCLLLGFFTRLASVAGALFLLSIIATQPPWLPGVEPTIYQTVELSGLLVLAGTGAGRWLGLDFFTWALFHRHDE